MTNRVHMTVSVLLLLSLWLCLASATGRQAWAEEMQSLDGSLQGAASPATTLDSNALAADTESRCFQAAMARSGDTAWCDVLISNANAALSPTAAAAAQLARSYHNRAVVLLNSGELELAEADLQAAMALQSQQPELHLTMANVRLLQGRFAEALELYNDAIAWSSPVPAGYFRNRALALRGLGQLQLAAADVARADAARAGRPVSPSDTGAVPEDESQ